MSACVVPPSTLLALMDCLTRRVHVATHVTAYSTTLSGTQCSGLKFHLQGITSNSFDLTVSGRMIFPSSLGLVAAASLGTSLHQTPSLHHISLSYQYRQGQLLKMLQWLRGPNTPFS